MATYIKDLVEDNGDITRPVTEAGAVLLSGGGDLETTLASKADQTAVDNKISIGDVQSTDIASNAVTTAKIAGSAVTTAKLANGAVTAEKLDPDATGWVYLGEQRLTSVAAEITFTLPAQYDNYKVVFYGAMASTASDGCWIDFIMYNGSTAINVVHQVQLVAGTTWSSTFNSGTFAMNIQSNPYAGLLFKFESWRAGANDWRHYTGSMASNAGGSASARTTIVNGRATSATQPTAFAVKTYGTGNVFNTGATIRVWASNN